MFQLKVTIVLQKFDFSDKPIRTHTADTKEGQTGTSLFC